MQETEIFYPIDVAAWRDWLAKNHLTKPSVWLVMHNKKSKRPSVTWREAVDAALCYGWIDSKKIKVDEHTAHQFFSKRKAKSTWSSINKEKVQQLIDSGLMTPAAYESIATAKENGSWAILDEVEALFIPADLEQALKRRVGAKDYFLTLSKSKKKMILQWIVLSKRPETRQKRIEEIADHAGRQQTPKQFA